MKKILIVDDGDDVRKSLSLFFFLFIILSFISTELIPQSLSDNFTDLTGQIVVFCSEIFGIPAFFSDNILTISGFKLKMVTECSALHFIIILTAGILAYPAHTLRYKLKGIVFGNLSIIFINVLRIVVLGIIGANFSSVFDFIHNYLWQGTFVIAVFLIYLIWLEKVFITLPAVRFFGICLLSITFFIFTLGFIMEPFLRALAWMSDKILILTSSGLSLSDKFLLLMKTNGLSILAVGNEIMFRDSGKLSYFPMSVNVFDSAVFLGLMTASVVIFSGLSKNQLMKNAKMIFTGIAILILLNLFFVSGIGFLIHKKVPEESMDVILWIMRGVSVVMPVLLWFFLKDGFQKPSTKNLKPENWSFAKNLKFRTAFNQKNSSMLCIGVGLFLCHSRKRSASGILLQERFLPQASRRGDRTSRNDGLDTSQLAAGLFIKET